MTDTENLIPSYTAFVPARCGTRGPETRKAGDIITDLFKNHFEPGFIENARSGAGLFSSWGEIVAELWPCRENAAADREPAENELPAVAYHSHVRDLENGLLLIEVDHPGWTQILQAKQAGLLSAVRRRFPGLGITGIAFRLGRGSAPQPDIHRT